MPLRPSLLRPIASVLAAGWAGPRLSAVVRGCGTRKSAAAEEVSVRRRLGLAGCAPGGADPRSGAGLLEHGLDQVGRGRGGPPLLVLT